MRSTNVSLMRAAAFSRAITIYGATRFFRSARRRRVERIDLSGFDESITLPTKAFVDLELLDPRSQKRDLGHPFLFSDG
jgi:hypothetical protein